MMHPVICRPLAPSEGISSGGSSNGNHRRTTV
jgi:hypothetical protein